MAVFASTPVELIEGVYATLDERVGRARESFGRPLTLAEKILANHLDPAETGVPERSVSYVDLRPDRVAMQDATAQMAWLQFMTAGLDEVRVPTTTHCDHLIIARTDARRDLLAALSGNDEVYEFLRSVCARYGAGFWKPGSGIIHQVVLENYAFPGGMMIGTDSHTPNAGGLAMVAVGVGGADAVDVMTGFPWNVRWPELIGVRLTGELSGWSSPKDVILKVADILTAAGGTGAIVEYFGPGARSLSATGKATICNMGAEIGATTSIFDYDESMGRYLARHRPLRGGRHGRRGRGPPLRRPRDRGRPRAVLRPGGGDRPRHPRPPTSTAPTPRTWPARSPISATRPARAAGRWRSARRLSGAAPTRPTRTSPAPRPSARDATAKGLRARTRLLVTPGSEQIRATIVRDGLMDDFEALGATVLANACGPCIGQWDRSGEEGHAPGRANVIVTSYNRNFPKRNDGDAATLAFVTSPETVIGLALAGTIDFDPVNGTLVNDDGEAVTLAEPAGIELPPDGFDPGAETFVAPPADGSAVEAGVSPDSERIQLLEPFAPWDGRDYEDLPVIAKARGKCTTDHISAAGPWLRYRGHLENISGNLYLGVVNAFNSSDDDHGYEVGHGRNQLSGEVQSLPDIAREYHAAGLRWVFIGDSNTGEGSSREHAAMEPRFRGCVLALARSFARIHETNLKKQGVLALTFADPADYERIGEDDRVAVRGLADLAPGRPVTVEVTAPGGAVWAFEGCHTLSGEQIEWFRAGSALNIIRSRAASNL